MMWCSSKTNSIPIQLLFDQISVLSRAPCPLQTLGEFAEDKKRPRHSSSVVVPNLWLEMVRRRQDIAPPDWGLQIQALSIVPRQVRPQLVLLFLESKLYLDLVSVRSSKSILQVRMVQ